MMDINFEYYKIFYYVAKYKNITRAAAALGSNQPNVTRVMKLLEEGLQCKLLVREARGIALTQEGERLYAHVEVAFHQLLRAQEEIGTQMIDGTGTVDIGATETALHLFLLDALRSFKETCPRVRIKIHNHTTPDILKQLSFGMKSLLSESKAHHEKLGNEIHSLLIKHNSEEKDPSPVAKGMSWLKTNMKIGMNDSDSAIADVMTDGCNMGVKSLHKYMNQYQGADKTSKDICKRLVSIEEELCKDLKDYL